MYRPLEGYFQMVQFNEMLTGQSHAYLMENYRRKQYAPRLDFENVYLCMTGFEKRIYTGFFGVPTKNYVEMTLQFEKELCQYLEENHCKSEMALLVYAHKQLGIAFSPEKDCPFSPMEIASHLHTRLQAMYEEIFLPCQAPIENFTVLSAHITKYEDIFKEFQRLREMHKLSYFKPPTQVLSAPILETLRQDFSVPDALSLCHELRNQITEANIPEVERILEELFMKRMKNSFHFPLCIDVLAEIKQQLYHFSAVYELSFQADIEQVFLLGGKLHIGELFASIRQLVLDCVQQISKQGKPRSYIVQEALRYMKSQYCHDISLGDIAKYVNVVPNYLSRLFNQEMEMAIPTYLNALRMEHAKKLLEQGNQKIFEISLAVGIENSRHFSRLFKRYAGLTPQEYRGQVQHTL